MAMKKAPELILVLALVLGASALSEKASAAARQLGEKTEVLGKVERVARAEAVMRSLRVALRGGALADLDRDGMVTRDEAMHYLDLRFARMDADQDAVLTEAEFVRAAATGSERGVKEALAARPRDAGFEAADLDGDGSLSLEEFLQAAMLHEAALRGTRPGEQARLATFRSLDGDGDGLIGRNDFMTTAAARFATSDADGDGRLPIWQFLALRF
jgi:Ca2+-binding EF-hand superfamily protein